jgi:hypothetical protein
MLAHSVRTRERYVAIVFFCGLHVEYDQEPVGVTGMVRSLVFQLLQNLESAGPHESAAWKIPGIMSWAELDGIAKSDLTQLCRLLIRLAFLQLSAGRTLVCIVDGVNHYQTDELEADVVMVVRTLHWLVQATKDGHPWGQNAAIKVLVTSSAASNGVSDLFRDEDDILSIVNLTQTNYGPRFSSLEVDII